MPAATAGIKPSGDRVLQGVWCTVRLQQCPLAVTLDSLDIAGFWNLYAIQSYEVPRRICKIIEFDAFHPVTSWVIREGSCASLCGAQVNMLGQCGIRMGWIGRSQNKINQEHSGAFWICTRNA